METSGIPKCVNDVNFPENSVTHLRLKVLNLVLSLFIHKTHTNEREQRNTRRFELAFGR